MSEIRELTINEINEVNGGVLPFIAAVLIFDVALIAFTAGVLNGYTEAERAE